MSDLSERRRDEALELIASAVRKRVAPSSRAKLLKLIETLMAQPEPQTPEEIERERDQLREITSALGMPLLRGHKRVNEPKPPKQGSLF